MKGEKKTIKAWAVVDVKNIGVDTFTKRRLFAGVEGDYHIFKTRKYAREYIDKQFSPQKIWDGMQFQLLF